MESTGGSTSGIRAGRSTIVSREDLWTVLSEIDRRYAGDGCLYLIGETSQLAEGWREWTTQIEFYADIPERRSHLSDVIESISADRGVEIIEEFPGDLIPLPGGYMDRTRALTEGAPIEDMRLGVRHFDPYSVVFRFVARGDEPDYHIGLMYLAQGWITFEEMTERLERLLPSFSLETIAQDPAEFRRKYRGLTQMWRKEMRPGTVHRPTAT